MSDSITIKKAGKISGVITTPPDKSISHRAVILSSLSKGRSIVKNFLRAEDTMSTLNAFRRLGIEITEVRSQSPSATRRGGKSEARSNNLKLIIQGKGIHGLKEPEDVIDCGNSGTTIRLLSGILSGNPFLSILTGDSSLRSRPMARVIKPLKEMGAEISARAEDRYPPVVINGKKLKGIKYGMPISSAQVKSSLLLAGLYTDGETEITEPVKSRDHTERMLPSYGVDLDVRGLSIRIKGGQELEARDTEVPGDFSSAAFFIAAALLVEKSDVTIKGVGINPTRTGLLDVLRRMGADIELKNIRDISGEPVADMRIKGSGGLRAASVTKEEIPSLIDEFPVLCILASKADGITSIRGAEELRVKESDRIKATVSGLRKMKVDVEEFKDGVSIKGNANLKGAVIDSYGDHRIAMAFSVAALAASGTTKINGISAVNISFPGFFEMLRGLSG